jgi:hypothetical protein
VSKKVIKIDVTDITAVDSIAATIRSLKEYATWLKNKTRELTERLAWLGTAEAARRFGAAMYDGVNDVRVSARPIPNGWEIVAEGQSVAFIEFGAGVYHNTDGSYPDRPAGLAPIGTYGQGHGSQRAWYFKDSTGEFMRTHGNPAAMGMWYAREEVIAHIAEIAREVFG